MPALRSGVPMNITLQAVSYTHLLAEADGRYTVTVLADSAWLQSADCVYPVRIDPTVNISDSSIGLYDVEQGSANTVMGDNNYPYCGSVSYTHLIHIGNGFGLYEVHLAQPFPCLLYTSSAYCRS